MGIIEIVMSILAGIVILASILTYLGKTGGIRAISGAISLIKIKMLPKKESYTEEEESYTAGDERIVDTGTASWPKRRKLYDNNKKLPIGVAIMVDAYSEFPLSDILKDPEAHSIIYTSLSYPPHNTT